MASEPLVLTESKEISNQSSPQARRCFNEHSLWSTNNQQPVEHIAQCYSNRGKYMHSWAQLISTGRPTMSRESTGQDRASNPCCPWCCAGTVLEYRMNIWALRIKPVTHGCNLWPLCVWEASSSTTSLRGGLVTARKYPRAAFKCTCVIDSHSVTVLFTLLKPLELDHNIFTALKSVFYNVCYYYPGIKQWNNHFQQ